MHRRRGGAWDCPRVQELSGNLHPDSLPRDTRIIAGLGSPAEMDQMQRDLSAPASRRAPVRICRMRSIRSKMSRNKAHARADSDGTEATAIPWGPVTLPDDAMNRAPRRFPANWSAHTDGLAHPPARLSGTQRTMRVSPRRSSFICGQIIFAFLRE